MHREKKLRFFYIKKQVLFQRTKCNENKNVILIFFGKQFSKMFRVFCPCALDVEHTSSVLFHGPACPCPFSAGYCWVCFLVSECFRSGLCIAVRISMRCSGICFFHVILRRPQSRASSRTCLVVGLPTWTVRNSVSHIQILLDRTWFEPPTTPYPQF